jgi:DNA-3-methyladenine glycosylase I
MKMIRGVNKMNRCNWVTNDPVYIHYHDHEWGDTRIMKIKNYSKCYH